MTLVREILKVKGQKFWSIAPDTGIQEALKMLAEKNIGALLVLEGKRLVGIFSERDYVRRIVQGEKVPDDVSVQEIMSPEVLYVTPEETMEECMALMTSKDIRYLPVLDDNELAGLLSIGDVVSACIANKDIEIAQLESYITGLLHGG